MKTNTPASQLILTVTGRLISLLAVVLGVCFVAFLFLDLAPGDPAELVLLAKTDSPTPAKIQAVRDELGLDKPVLIRFFKWLCAAAQGDLGRSYRTGDSAAREIAGRLPVTLTLAAATILFVIFLSALTGFAGGLLHGSPLDWAIRACTALSIALPDFVLGVVLVYVFSVKVELFSPVGMSGARSFILPVLTLGLSMAAVHGQVLRAGVMEVLNTDYVRFAYAKGLGRWTVVRRHVAKNALLPVVTLWGISLGHLFGGAVIIENVFSLPGLGTLLVESVLQRDIPIVQGIVLFAAMAFFSISRLVDATMSFFVPSVAFGKERDL